MTAVDVNTMDEMSQRTQQRKITIIKRVKRIFYIQLLRVAFQFRYLAPSTILFFP